MSEFLVAELREERAINDRLGREFSRLRAEHDGNPDDQRLAETVQTVETAVNQSNERLEELEGLLREDDQRRDILRQHANSLSSHESGAFEHPVNHGRSAAFDESQRRMEGYLRSGDLTSKAVDRLDKHLRQNDQIGADAQYTAAISQPAYAKAFGKVLRYGDGAATRMTSEELDAMSQVAKAEQFRTMVEGTGTAGGYALPIAVDPTFTLVSSGAVNPIRDIATVRTIGTRELKLLATDGVVASYAAELTEASDNSPVLAQPDVTTERAQMFVPVSIELTQDWAQLQGQLAELFADAKDVLEAEKFLTGAGHGSNEPQGLLTGIPSASKVTSAGAGAVATGDIYTLKAAIPFRFLPTAKFLASPAMVDRLYRLVPRASTTDPTLVDDTRTHVLGFDLVEYSAMTAAITTGSDVAIAGDFKKGFVVVDRLGMSIEVVAHVLGTARNYPIGARGYYCYWRGSSAVIASSDSCPLTYLATS